METTLRIYGTNHWKRLLEKLFRNAKTNIMIHSCETLVDDNGVEILVGYSYKKDRGYYEEPGNPDTYIEPMVYTELNSVEVVIKGKGVDILDRLDDKQKNWIIDNLNYE